MRERPRTTEVGALPARRDFRRTLISAAAMIVGILPLALRAQDTGFDEARVALTYHHLTGDPLDVRAVAERSDAARRASNFDRPDVVNAEAAKLTKELDGMDTQHVFVLSVNDRISEYDHDRGEFTIQLFAPGTYVPVQAFGQQYQLVFANAAGAASIPMPREQARAFDARLNSMGRSVLDQLRFRIVGRGDPAGAVTGDRVIRAQLLSVRVADRNGAELFTPDLTASAMPAVAERPFDLAATDIAGLRVGVKAKELETALARLYGEAERGSPGEKAFPGFAAALSVNSMGCFTIPGRRNNPEPGADCVTAFVDEDDVVRAIRVERLFPWFDAEVFRADLVRKYGPVADARNGSGFSLGWGPEVDQRLVYDRSGPHRALAAYYTSDTDFMARGGNALPRIRVVLQLVDAEWAAKEGK
jgi:hypothetical protein